MALSAVSDVWSVLGGFWAAAEFLEVLGDAAFTGSDVHPWVKPLKSEALFLRDAFLTTGCSIA